MFAQASRWAVGVADGDDRDDKRGETISDFPYRRKLMCDVVAYGIWLHLRDVAMWRDEMTASAEELR
jgi:hypothetical protein